MPLNQISVPPGTKKSTKSEKLQVPVRGQRIKRLVAAYVAAKEAKEVIDEEAKYAKDLAVREIIRSNVEVGGPVTKTATLTDETDASVNVTVKSQYAAVDETVAVNLFEAINARRRSNYVDINDFIVKTLSATFNSDVFLDANGDFSQVAFDAFNSACQGVADRLGIENPLKTKVVVKAKPGFDDVRFSTFTLEEQGLIVESMPATVSLTPIVAK